MHVSVLYYAAEILGGSDKTLVWDPVPVQSAVGVYWNASKSNIVVCVQQIPASNLPTGAGWNSVVGGSNFQDRLPTPNAGISNSYATFSHII